jgi:hypothetical protein
MNTVAKKNIESFRVQLYLMFIVALLKACAHMEYYINMMHMPMFNNNPAVAELATQNTSTGPYS